jgi:hypothetical protein
MPSTTYLHQQLVRDVERYSWTAGSSAEVVRNGGMETVPVGKEVAASCVTAACAVLHPTLRPLLRSDVQECAICKLCSSCTAKSIRGAFKF